MKRIGADFSMISTICGSELSEAVNDPTKPRLGLLTHTMSHGNKPLTRNTAIRMPQRRNHRCPLGDMVLSTSALMIALSTLMMISNNASPRMINAMEKMSIGEFVTV